MHVGWVRTFVLEQLDHSAVESEELGSSKEAHDEAENKHRGPLGKVEHRLPFAITPPNLIHGGAHTCALKNTDPHAPRRGEKAKMKHRTGGSNPEPSA